MKGGIGRRVVGGRYPSAPQDLHPLEAPLEPEVGSNLLNSKLTYIFRFFNSQYSGS